MCQSNPTRRCSGYQEKRLVLFTEKFNHTKIARDALLVESAQRDYNATPRGMALLLGQVTGGQNVNAEMLDHYREALIRRSSTAPIDYPDAVSKLVPRDKGNYGQYYAQNDAKHFGDESIAGSKFTGLGITSTEDVVSLALRQRGTLDGDDRNAFIAAGCSPDAFRDGTRYLMVRTPGTVGIINSRDVNDSTVVRVTRDKIGAPCSASIDIESQVETDYACVVIGNNDDKELVFTAFPGPATIPGTGTLDAYEGQSLTVARVREIFGHDIHLLTRIR